MQAPKCGTTDCSDNSPEVQDCVAAMIQARHLEREIVVAEIEASLHRLIYQTPEYGRVLKESDLLTLLDEIGARR